MGLVLLPIFMTHFYLTIDDGPSNDTINKLELFEKHKILAIWFCLGQNLEKYQEVVLKLIQKGHIIANHSHNHPFFSHISFNECEKQIIQTEKIIDDLYNKAGIQRPIKLFRFPYGEQGHFKNGKPSLNAEKLAHKEKLHELLKYLGFHAAPISEVEYKGIYSNQSGDIDWLWSYDIQEWAIGNTEGYQITFDQMINNLGRYLKSFNKERDQIILTHDHGHNAKYFKSIMEMFFDKNIKFNLPNFK